MHKKDRKKAHVTILKTELVFISVALVLSAFVLGFFTGKGKGGAVFEIEPISYTEQATGRNPTALPASSGEGDAENPAKNINEDAAAEASEPSQTTGENPADKGESGAENGVSQPEIDGKININTADLAQLKSLPGIGDVLAGRIVEYREKVGGFKNIYEIMDVSGIGEKTFQKLEPLIYVG